MGMSKITSPFKAYNRLCNHIDSRDDYYTNGQYEEDNGIIENTLSRAKFLEQRVDKQEKEIARWKEIAMTFEKPVRALEEIQSLVNFDICEIQGQWYLCLGNVFLKALKKPISKETADLLKEVLL